jgi:hypothetical protein
MPSTRTLSRVAIVLSAVSLSACAVPSESQRRMLDSMIGRSETDLVRAYGVPSRTFTTNGHTFLAYIQNETDYSPGTPGLGWGWGGGWGGGYGGFGGGWGGFGGYGGGFGGFPPSFYQTSCATTFEVDAGRVSAWTLRGNGC